MTILDRIFATKRKEVAAARLAVPEADLRAMARDADAPRGFQTRLMAARGLGLIAEVKKASPSKGVIRPDFDPAEIAAAYRDAGADCLSVLTDHDYFQGDPAYLPLCREVSGLPVLRKDFLYDPYQVWEARAWGADAVLLIVAMLDDDDLARLFDLARELGMDALVEVHTEGEAMRALDLGASLVGINNRDLATFETDLGTTERLAPLLTPTALVVAESALSTRADLDRVARAGARAVLIGETFTRARDVARKVREVMGVD